MLGKRLHEEAERRMEGDAWRAYAEFSVLAAKMLLRMPQDIEGQQAWLTGHGLSGTGRAYFEEFERLLEAAPSPEVLLVIASFFWNDALVSMWRHDCGGFMCATEQEFESMMMAAGLAWTAVKEKPALLETGGTAAQLLYTTREKIEREEMTEAECKDAVDNDGDGKIDCRDNSCQHHASCGGRAAAGGENSAFLCQDKIDNDGDRSTDCDDAECSAFIYCSSREPEDDSKACQDGVDNDLDGSVDCGDRDCAEQFKFCDGVDGAYGNDRGRPLGEWEDWTNQFLLYGGMLFRSPYGSNTDDVELWGFGFTYQRRIVGWNAARWFHLDTAIGIGGLLHKWPDHDKFSADLEDQQTKVPEGVAFALSLEPTLRLVFGTTVGAYLEGYYPFALLFADPFSVGYKVWGMRVGVYFTKALNFGVTMSGITPGAERHGLWTILITLSY
ncbi:MAG: hypothetical protein JRF63_05245 [Deltaproteobacteria bacterium]|nr:hypothetical protein [Deltaproteobacteria bacterium]